MCDFHSVIVSTDGRLFHLPENSHSRIASHYGLHNGPDKREFYECEWDCVGDMPAYLVRDRPYGYGDQVPAIVQRVAESHYAKLQRVLSGELNWQDTAPFNQPEFSDVPAESERWRARAEARELERIRREEAQARKEAAEALADKLSEQFEADFICLESDGRAALIRALLESLGEEISDVFEDEFNEAREEAREEGHDAGYEAGQDAGYESASEDMYTSDYVYENIEDFIDSHTWIRREDAAEACEDEIAEAREEGKREGFAEGFAACKSGATPSIEFINGLPSFLFK